MADNDLSRELENYISFAMQYGYAANILYEVIDDDSRVRNEYVRLKNPAINAAAHSLECMVKSCALLNNADRPKDMRNGHDFNRMLEEAYAVPLHDVITANARFIAEEMKADPRYACLQLDSPVAWMKEAIHALGEIHFKNGSMLRYGPPLGYEEIETPVSPLLIRTIYEASQDLGRDRSRFILGNA